MTTHYMVIPAVPGVSEDSGNGIVIDANELPSTLAGSQQTQILNGSGSGGSNGIAIGYAVSNVANLPAVSMTAENAALLAPQPSDHHNDDKAVLLGAGFAILVGEMNGIADLPADLGADIARFVSHLMRAIIAMAKKFKDRARRRTLAVDDLNAAAAFFGISAQHGYRFANTTQFRHIAGSGEDLFVLDDHDVELSGYIGVGMPKLPLMPTIKSHWLVIDGVQPAIPENPVPPAAANAAGGTLADEVAAEDGALTAGSRPLMLLNAMARGVRKTEQVQIKTTTTHALSLEQQIFFKEITEAIMGGDENRRLEALNCLAVDCGLQALLPRFSITIAEGVRCNIAQHNLAILIYLMRMAQSLVQNESLSLERCLHELLPAIMSCILSRQLCSLAQSDSHWALREFSARLLAVVAKKYENAMLQSRITRALARAFTDPNSSLATLYGAVFALNQLGADTTKAVVAAKADTIYAILRRVVADPNTTPSEKSAANRLRGEMTSCMSAIERNVIAS